VNPGAGIIAWIIIGAAAGWLTSRCMGSPARPSALTHISMGIIGALVAGFVTRGVLTNLGYENLGLAGSAGALLGSCSLIFGWQALWRRQV
jgi:uncharacterized membrane protein YeaQ/YmgE (transglycosylase-associated protein family)